MRLPVREQSRVMLVGTANYADDDLEDLPAVANNLSALARALTESRRDDRP